MVFRFSVAKDLWLTSCDVNSVQKETSHEKIYYNGDC